MEDLVGKTIRVLGLDCGCCPTDARWIGHTGKVTKVNQTPDGWQIWVDGMSVSLLSDCDAWEVVDGQ